MKLKEMVKLFEKHGEEYLQFELVEKPLHSRPDLAAFLLLDQLVPGKNDMVSASEHDEFFLSVDVEEVAKVITEEQIVTLIRCGIRYSSYDCFCMFA
jgi:hypothetical protein